MRYLIKTMTPDGVLQIGEINAPDEASARGAMSGKGQRVIAVEGARMVLFRVARRSPRFDVVQFARSLCALLESGVTLVEAIDTLAEDDGRHARAAELDGLLIRLRGGMSFSDALRERPDAFPPVLVAAVQAAERTGDLAPAIDRYAAQQSRADGLARQLRSAAMYPMLLMVVASVVVLFLLGYVVPRFSAVYADMSGTLPLPSRLLMQAGQFIDGHGAMVIALLLALLVTAVAVLRHGGGSVFVWGLLTRVPGIAPVMRLYQLTRFYGALGMLLESGVPVLRAVEMCEGALTGPLAAAGPRVRSDVASGAMLSKSLERAGLATAVARRMMSVGERTGRLGEMLGRASRFHETELARRMNDAVRLAEPVLMIVTGLLIGGIVLLLYIPIFELAQGIS